MQDSLGPGLPGEKPSFAYIVFSNPIRALSPRNIVLPGVHRLMGGSGDMLLCTPKQDRSIPVHGGLKVH
jgi:hypothetical protein